MNNQEVAKKVVDRMLEVINQGGPLPWAKPWAEKRGTATIFDGYTEIEMVPKFWSRSGKPYQGINVLLLSLSGHEGEFITFNQCKAEGGKVKKGAKSSMIVFWTQISKETEELDENGEKIVKVYPVLKTYNVFSIDDCEGIQQKHNPEPIKIRVPMYHNEPVTGIDPDSYNPAAEAIIADYVKRSGTLTIDAAGLSNRAYYQPALDHVVVPNIIQFSQVEEYYSTLFHELGHSTGHHSRLNRFTGEAANAAFGSETYSREELVAEITAATILNTLGLESGNSFRNSAAYVKSWSEHIKNDPMMFITAASRADKAVNCILGIE